MHKVLFLYSEREIFALRRIISRNLPAAPEKDKPALNKVYERLCAIHENAEQGDLFNEKDSRNLGR